jgi:hypothetical protein
MQETYFARLEFLCVPIIIEHEDTAFIRNVGKP